MSRIQTGAAPSPTSGSTWTTVQLRQRASRHRGIGIRAAVTIGSKAAYDKHVEELAVSTAKRLRELVPRDRAYADELAPKAKQAIATFKSGKSSDMSRAENLFNEISLLLDQHTRDLNALAGKIPALYRRLQSVEANGGAAVGALKQAAINAGHMVKAGNRTDATELVRQLEQTTIARETNRSIDTLTGQMATTLATPGMGMVAHADRFDPANADAAFKKSTKEYRKVVDAMGRLMALNTAAPPDETAVRDQLNEVISAANTHIAWLNKKHPKNLGRGKSPYIDELNESQAMVDEGIRLTKEFQRQRKARIDALNLLCANESEDSYDMLLSLADSPHQDVAQFAQKNLANKANVLVNAFAENGETAQLKKFADKLDPAVPEQAAVLAGAIGACSGDADRLWLVQKLTGIADDPLSEAQTLQLCRVLLDNEAGAGAAMFAGKPPVSFVNEFFEAATSQDLSSADREKLGQYFAEVAVKDQRYLKDALTGLLQAYTYDQGTQPLRSKDAPIAPLKMTALAGGGKEALEGALNELLGELTATDKNGVMNGSRLEIDPYTHDPQKHGSIEDNLKEIEKIVRDTLAKLFAMKLPSAMCQTCKLIYDDFRPKLGEDGALKLVGGHIFLRIIMAMFGRDTNNRAAVYSAKVIQNIANHTLPRDEHMAALHPFVTELTPEFDKFLKLLVISAEPFPKLNDVLANPAAKAALRPHYERLYQTESLNFLDATDPIPTGDAAEQVYLRFITDDSPEQVNINADEYDGFNDVYSTPPATRDWSAAPWDATRRHLFTLLHGNYNPTKFTPEIAANIRFAFA